LVVRLGIMPLLVSGLAVWADGCNNIVHVVPLCLIIIGCKRPHINRTPTYLLVGTEGARVHGLRPRRDFVHAT